MLPLKYTAAVAAAAAKAAAPVTGATAARTRSSNGPGVINGVVCILAFLLHSMTFSGCPCEENVCTYMREVYLISAFNKCGSQVNTGQTQSRETSTGVIIYHFTTAVCVYVKGKEILTGLQKDKETWRAEQTTTTSSGREGVFKKVWARFGLLKLH